MDKKNSALLGQLLVRAGVLDPLILDIALEKASSQHMRLGQVLLYSGLVPNHVLKASLQAQRMVRQSVLSLTHAVEGIKAVVSYGIDLNTALARLRWLTGHRQIHQFARLALDAKIIDIEKLGKMLSLTVRTGQPLGKLLLTHNIINNELRHTMIDALIFVMCGEVTYEHAVAAVRAANRTDQNLCDLLGISGSPLSILGHEFRLSGLFHEIEIADLVEESLQRETVWEGIYVTENLSAQLRFAASLTLSKMLDNGTLSAAHAQKICRELLLSTNFVLDRLDKLTDSAPPQQRADSQKIA